MNDFSIFALWFMTRRIALMIGINQQILQASRLNKLHFPENHYFPFHPILEAKPFISLLVRPHEGYAVSRSQSTACRLIEPTGINKSGITLSPLQTIIQPHGEASTFVSIDGRIASLQKVAKLEAYAQGFISIEEAGDNVRLPESLLLPQLRLNLKATAMQPMWVLKCLLMPILLNELS